MQKARIRTGWKNKDKSISVTEFANALSAICWRLSLNAAKNLHEQGFIYETDHQRIAVIREYLFFFIHCADRLMFEELPQTERTTFLSALVKDCHRHERQNSHEILARDRLTDDFVERLNQTAAAMSAFRFSDRQPGYEIYRLLGARILDIMGESQTNRWVIDHVMDIDGPNAYNIFRKSLDKLKKSSGI